MQTSLEELFGPTLHLNASTLEVSFKTAFQRLHTTFYRSKLTSWMAAQEEDYRSVHATAVNSACWSSTMSQIFLLRHTCRACAERELMCLAAMSSRACAAGRPEPPLIVTC